MRVIGLFAAAICGALGAMCVMQVPGLALPLTWADLEVRPHSTSDDATAEIGGWDGTLPTYSQVDATPDQAPAGLTWRTPAADDPHDYLTRTASTFGTRDRAITARTISDRSPSAPAVGTRTASGWVVVGHSAKGESLHTRTLGNGNQTTLIVAGLDGEDIIAVNWIDRFVRQLQESPESVRNHTLVFLRAVNPDGLLNRRFENANGIALTRNFPTAGYRPGGRPSAGKGPASEPETRVLLQVLYDVQPRRVVHLTSTPRKSSAECNGVAAEATASLSAIRGMSVQTFDAKEHPGSLEDFVTTVLGAEMVSLQLAIGDDWRTAAIGHFPTMLAAGVPQLHRANLAPADEAESPSPFQLDRIEEEPESLPTIPTPPASTDRSLLQRPRRSGFQELPPPSAQRGR
jgi:hypothetical protein